jgi:hypothetical protein
MLLFYLARRKVFFVVNKVGQKSCSTFGEKKAKAWLKLHDIQNCSLYNVPQPKMTGVLHFYSIRQWICWNLNGTIQQNDAKQNDAQQSDAQPSDA